MQVVSYESVAIAAAAGVASNKVLKLDTLKSLAVAGITYYLMDRLLVARRDDHTVNIHSSEPEMRAPDKPKPHHVVVDNRSMEERMDFFSQM
jgi:hypothetical protein